MIDVRSRRSASGARPEPVFNGSRAAQDDEARLAAALRAAAEPEDGPPPRREPRGNRLRIADYSATLEARAAAAIVDSVETRLPGRIGGLEVRLEHDQFVLAGVASSYYVKQVAQHVAMNALNEFMLGRLVNEIVVRSIR